MNHNTKQVTASVEMTQHVASTATHDTDYYQILRFSEVCEYGKFSRSTLYAKLSPQSKHYDSTFPRPVKIGPSAVGIFKGQLIAWLMNRPRT